MPLKLNTASAIISYQCSTVEQVMRDLLVKYGKDEIIYIIDRCVSEIEGDTTKQLLEFVRNIRDGKFHGHGFEHPDVPCNCNELAAADFLQNWRGLTLRALDAALWVCQFCGEASELSSQRCSVCNAPRK